jgi:hypothetical protein
MAWLSQIATESESGPGEWTTGAMPEFICVLVRKSPKRFCNQKIQAYSTFVEHVVIATPRKGWDGNLGAATRMPL